MRDGRLLILVVDDQEMPRKFLTGACEELNYGVVTAENGAEAISHVLADYNNEIDVILLDVEMPVMTGIQACSRIRGFNPDIPIVFISGHDSQPVIEACFEAGASQCVTKTDCMQALEELAERADSYAIERLARRNSHLVKAAGERLKEVVEMVRNDKGHANDRRSTDKKIP